MATYKLISNEAYKSLGPFDWVLESGLTVLCGPNGCGKSQFLELIFQAFNVESDRLTPYLDPKPTRDVRALLVPSDFSMNPPGSWDPTQLKLRSIVEGARGIQASLSSPHHRWINGELSDLERQIGRGPGLSRLSEPDLAEAIPMDGPLRLQTNPSELATRMVQCFLLYNLRRADSLLRATTENDCAESVQQPPWELLNDLLKNIGSTFSVEPPRGLVGVYCLRFTDSQRGIQAELESLSAGERAMVSLALWLYSADAGHLPKVVLLDEPDAHLHATILPKFLDALQTLLVKKHGCTVVMTTHRPDMIAVAPEKQLYEVRNRPQVSVKRASRAVALRHVAGRLVAFMPRVRVYFVEDEDDVEFFRAAFSLLQDELDAANTITPDFRSVSQRKGSGAESEPSGGRGAVRGILKKMAEATTAAPELSCLVEGIIDGDGGNIGQPGVHVLPRYSWENFVVDPLVVATGLVESGQTAFLPQLSEVRPGGMQKFLRKSEVETLQELADKIVARMEESLPSLSTAPNRERRPLEYTTGLVIQVPAWLFSYKGKDLRGVVAKSFKAQNLTAASLRANMERLGLVPVDLRAFMRVALQADREPQS